MSSLMLMPTHYPTLRLQNKQRGFILLLTLTVLAIMLVALSFGWNQYYANSKSVLSTKQSVQHYQSIRGELLVQSNTLKNAGLATIEDAIAARGATVNLPLLSAQALATGGAAAYTVTLQSLNIGSNVNAVQVNGATPALYGSMCQGLSVTADGTATTCYRMLLTVVKNIQVQGRNVALQQSVGFGVARP